MHHTLIRLGGLLALFALISLETPASAQEELNQLLEPVDAPSRALELKAGTGYTQGFGDAAPGRSLQDISGPGIGLSVDVDYRATPRWSVGLESQYQTLSNEQNSTVRGFATNLGGTFHLEPVLRGDPWVRLGTGFRWLWESDPTGAPGTTVVRYALEAISLKLGYDVRATENTSVAPVLGAGLDTFLGDTPAQVGVFIYAGVQCRYDIGGERGNRAVAALPSSGSSQ